MFGELITILIGLLQDLELSTCSPHAVNHLLLPGMFGASEQTGRQASKQARWLYLYEMINEIKE